MFTAGVVLFFSPEHVCTAVPCPSEAFLWPPVQALSYISEILPTNCTQRCATDEAACHYCDLDTIPDQSKVGFVVQWQWDRFFSKYVGYPDGIITPVLRTHSFIEHRHCVILGWVHTCNVTAYRNTVSWQCGRDSCPRNVSKVGYAVTLRACSVCCRYLAVASKGWYGYGRSRCGRATSRCTSTPVPAVTVSSLWCDGQIPTAHRTSP